MDRRTSWWLAAPALLAVVFAGEARAQSPCEEYGALTLAEGCGDLTYQGCCMGNGDLAWCEDGYVCSLPCSENQPPQNTCGWNAEEGYYDCGQTGADPSGEHPLECPACTPDCTGKVCGNGGCPLMPGACGTCDTCGEECVDGQCVFTACEGKECGDDGCGGSCGTCAEGDVCVDGECCTPACDGKNCGPDGCGGECGTCGDGFYCDDTQNCKECSCGDKQCGEDQCGQSCGECGEGFFCDADGYCQECTCEGKTCGGDGCGNPCGTCPAGQACANGTCTADVPFECQVHETPGCPGCECEACVCAMDSLCCDPDWYWDQFCVQECQYDCNGPACDSFCFPACEGLVCGDDGCGGACGTCPEGTYCGAGGKACLPCTCEGKQCGDDGCGNSCGECAEGETCANGVCVPAGCTPQDGPGCGGCACEACVCAADSFCCEVAWDELCVEACSVDCGANCPCVPNCGDAECGDDGCGGQCPPGCGEGEFCDAGVCATCTCEGKQCGDDGCGNSCGTCGENQFCNDQGQCIPPYPDSCLGLNEPSAPECPEGLGYAGCCDGSGRAVWCEDGQLFCIDCAAGQTTCGWLADEGFYDCGQTGSDPSGQFPYECSFAPCEPDCTGQMCGNGGCPGAGDVCGTCPEGLVCIEGQCQIGGCGDVTFAGCCDGAKLKWCEDGQIQTIDCSTKQPPNDVCGWKADAEFYDCGGSGADPTGTFPLECPAVCEPDCTGKQCGNGGCPDYPDTLCGTCAEGEICRDGACKTPGACENEADMSVVQEKGIDALNQATAACVLYGGCGTDQACLVNCIINGKPDATPPIEGTGLSDACAGCFATTGLCGLQNCLQQCAADSTSAPCKSCLWVNCTPAFGECTGLPVSCTPDCTDKVCGDDGCGNQCAPGCGANETCVNGQCEPICVPACEGKECGDDGCNGTCPPGCDAGEQCIEGQCCAPNCQDKECGDDGCGGSCGTCPAGEACSPAGQCECQADCTGKECGDDGCGGSCGDCGTGEQCVAGQCEALPPPDQGGQDAAGGDVPTQKDTGTGGGGGGGGGGCAAGGLGAPPWTFLFLMSGLGAAVLSRRRWS